MTDPVERVARAICGAFPGIGNVDAQFSESTSVQQMWMDISRAAIAAMPGEPVASEQATLRHLLAVFQKRADAVRDEAEARQWANGSPDYQLALGQVGGLHYCIGAIAAAMEDEPLPAPPEVQP